MLRCLFTLIVCCLALPFFAQPKPMKNTPETLHLKMHGKLLEAGKPTRIRIHDRTLHDPFMITVTHAKVEKRRRNYWVITPDGSAGVTVSVMVRKGTLRRTYGEFFLPVK
jgi:hypothetical protein